MSDAIYSSPRKIDTHTHLLDIISTVSEKHRFDFTTHIGMFLHVPKIPPNSRKTLQKPLTIDCLLLNPGLAHTQEQESLEKFCKNPFFLSIGYDENLQCDQYFFGQKEILDWNVIKTSVFATKYQLTDDIIEKIKKTRAFLFYNISNTSHTEYHAFPFTIYKYSCIKNPNKEPHKGFIIHSVDLLVEFYQKHIDEVKETYINVRKYNLFE